MYATHILCTTYAQQYCGMVMHIIVAQPVQPVHNTVTQCVHSGIQVGQGEFGWASKNGFKKKKQQ